MLNSAKGWLSMSRAEMRRAAKRKSKTATYNLTEEQIDILVKEKMAAHTKEIKEEAAEEAINTAMILLLTLPLEVLMDFYWKKSYAKKIPEFTEHVLDYYNKWENGELDMEKLQEDLWIYGGVKLEKTT
jgi:hypothetical protein